MTGASVRSWFNGHTRLVLTLASVAISALTALGFAVAEPWVPRAEQQARDAAQDTAIVRLDRKEKATHDSIFKALEAVQRLQETEILAHCLSTTERVIRVQLRCSQREGGR